MIWQSMAEEQAQIIESLAELCLKLINQLAQYKNIDEEEKRLADLKRKTYEEIKNT